ncbi:MAG: hypothetical protein M1812_003352 [Candelaria pacifica]|nr:MAG: hypothetical protein M1812_003352 [Candelaria pacifica]
MAYLPSITDVFNVKKVLQNPISRIYLPLEIVDLIIDHASYWPHTTVTAYSLVAVGGGRESASNVLCLRTWPLGAERLDAVKTLEEEQTEKGRWWNWDFWATKLRLTTEADNQVKDEPTWHPPRGTHPCRKIVFELKSHDQGHSGERTGQGTYVHSWTWFDAGIEAATFWPSVHSSQGDTLDELDGKLQSVGHSIPWLSGYDPAKAPFHPPEGYSLQYQPQTAEDGSLHPFLPPETRVQSNVHAQIRTETHNVTWNYTDCFDANSTEADEAAAVGRGKESVDGAFVRRLRTGDCVTLWARARFPAWRNVVEKAKVHVFWAV